MGTRSCVVLLGLTVACTGVIEDTGAHPPTDTDVECRLGGGQQVSCLPRADDEDACADGLNTGSSQLQRLSTWQVVNTLEDLFGSDALTGIEGRIRELPDESLQDDFRILNRFVDEPLMEWAVDAGLELSDLVRADGDLRERVFGACEDPAECAQTYVDGFATRIFRRPLSDDEKERARGFVMAAEQPEQALGELLAAHLASPHFLIHWELGESEEGGLLYLTPYEVASRLSYGLADSPPGEGMLALAASGELMNPDTMRAEAERLLNSERGRAKVVAQVFAWLELQQELDASNLPAELLDGMDVRGLSEAAVAETERFIEHIVFEERGGVNELLRSNLSFAEHSTLAAIYGHAPATDGPARMRDRQGLLHRLPFLFSESARTDLIARGVAVRRHLFCDSLPTPDFDIINRRDELRPLSEDEVVALDHLSLVEHETSEPGCMTCHSTINPTGGSFENFDSLGRLRDVELTFYSDGRRGEEVAVRDTSLSIPVHEGGSLAAESSTDLLDYLGAHESTAACLSLNLFQQARRREVERGDECTMHSALRAVLDGEGIFEASVRFFLDDAALRRPQVRTEVGQ